MTHLLHPTATAALTTATVTLTTSGLLAVYLDYNLVYHLKRHEKARSKIQDYQAVIAKYLPGGQWDGAVYYRATPRFEDVVKQATTFVREMRK
jgi:hypothetical protein